jgi:hypothetical protein
MKLALPVSATPAKFAILSVYYFPVSTTAVRHDITGVNDTGKESMAVVNDTSKESIAVVIDTGEVRSNISYFIPNLFYTKFILYQTYFTLNLFNT